VAKVRTRGFDQTDLEYEPPLYDPDVSADIQRTLSQLQAWNEVFQGWRKLWSDDVGRIITARNPGGITQASQFVITVNAIGTFFNGPTPNQNRITIYFQNTGANDVNVLPIGSAALFVGLRIAPGDRLELDWLRGNYQVYASGGTTSVEVTEIFWIVPLSSQG
jgi:hypothetical protein